MLTVEIVEKKLKKALSKLSISKSGITKKETINENDYDNINGGNIAVEINLDFNLDSLLNNLSNIYNEKLLIDNITTYPIKKSFFGVSDNEVLRGLKDYKSFLVNNLFYIFYKVSPVDKILSKFSIDNKTFKETVDNNTLDIEDVSLNIENIELEKIIIELGVLYVL